VADFLSDDWITALGAACGAVSSPAGSEGPDAGPLVIEPVVTGVPTRGEVRYRISFAGGTCAVTPGDDAAPGGPADVRLETDYVTAVALSRGTANAQSALADGRLRVSGDVASLAAHATALARLDDLFAELRASTTYPPP
jgi:hypothetical protein